MSKINVRFAPSPTGKLHVGNLRTALVNYLYARQQNGQFMLRIDDTDEERSRPEFETAIRNDLEWMGMKWDCEDRQSARLARDMMKRWPSLSPLAVPMPVMKHKRN